MPELAIHGGTPVRNTMLPYGRQWVRDDDIEAVLQVPRSDWMTIEALQGWIEQNRDKIGKI